MSRFFRDREHVHQVSVIAYVVMLGLLVPLSLFAMQKEQEVRTRASEKEAVVSPTLTPTPMVKSSR